MPTTFAQASRPLTAKILCFHGGRGPFVPDSSLLEFKEEMDAKEADYEVVVFARCYHAFTRPDKTSPQDKAAGFFIMRWLHAARGMACGISWPGAAATGLRCRDLTSEHPSPASGSGQGLITRLQRLQGQRSGRSPEPGSGGVFCCNGLRGFHPLTAPFMRRVPVASIALFTWA